MKPQAKQVAVEEMKLYSDTYDTYVASSLEHLERLIPMFLGESYEDATGNKVADEWSEIPPDKEVKIYWGEAACFDGAQNERLGDKAPDVDHPFRVTALARDWARSQEPGFLCSTEF